MITSARNPKLRHIRALLEHPRARREAGAFVVEGVRLAEEALHAGWEAQLVLYSASLPARGRAVVESFAGRGAPVEEVAPHVLKSVSDTETPQGILAVLAICPLPLPAAPNFVLIPDGVRDPGNLGTILRTASAAGVQAVLLPPGAADAYAPKVVRSAMGAHFRLPIHSLSWPEIHSDLRLVRVYLADPRGELPYTQADFRSPLALIVGGEAAGAGGQAQTLADCRVHIPMPGGAESLNAAVAAAVLMFEVVRQRDSVQYSVFSVQSTDHR